ncbi:MAG TPA: type III pantothenate kinase [Candidatus Kapabacteria bacterium]|nr:type III pantothenate kinase [Candidatus Kapabacteria bacterium]
MILAVNIGNTNVAFGLFDDNGLTHSFSYPTRTLKEQRSLPSELLELTHIDKIGIASVVPEVTDVLRATVQRQFPAAMTSVLKNSDVPIINRYHQPEQAGTDRLLGSLAAYRIYATDKRPLIIIDLGTATTFDCVTSNGEYLGGSIALGIGSSAKALASLTAQLPEIKLSFPKHALGRTTLEAIQSGIIFGAIDSAEGMIKRLTGEVFPNKEPIIIATGGSSELLKNRTSIIHFFDPYLVFKGIVMTMSSL